MKSTLGYAAKICYSEQMIFFLIEESCFVGNMLIRFRWNDNKSQV